MRVRDKRLAQPLDMGPVGAPRNADALGQFTERIARFLGTSRYLAIQTVVVVVWIVINAVAVGLRWDPYPFILLNLAFSTQAAYAAPLILLAQNRQDARDRALAERDREVNDRTLADTEFLTRELASIRIALKDVATAGDIEDIKDRLATLGGEGEGDSEQD